VQCVPHLAAGAKQLFVFQRTPSAINVRDNRPTDPEWAKSLKPGWQQARMDNFNIFVSGGSADQDLVNDGWTDILGRIGRGSGASDQVAEQIQLADFGKMEKVRARVDALVRDPVTAEALKPYYNQMCKRPCFHDEFLQTFNRPNVTLVDTNGRGVDCLTERGVVFDDREYEIDCLIYGTGFEFQTSFALRTGYEIYGRDGQSLSNKWKEGISTLYGMHTRGFPNCFIMGNAQQANTPNFTHMLNIVSHHISYIVKSCLDREISAVEPSEAAERAWVDEVMAYAPLRQKFSEECTPGYYNNEGMPSPLTARNSFYIGGSIKFIKLLDDWRVQNNFEGFELA
jgi:cyclohexanone monooxygenase